MRTSPRGLLGSLVVSLLLTTVGWAANLFPDDSRTWSQTRSGVVFTDWSKAEPATALITGSRQKGKWKLIPYATAEWQGTALSCYSATGPAPVRLPLPVKGWHAVYVGLATTSGGFNMGPNGARARLTGEPVYKRMACNLPLLPNRRAQIQEQFLTVADLQGQALEVAPLLGRPATICYAKVVPLTTAEVQSWQGRLKGPRKYPAIATFDGHSWIWPYRPQTAEELLEEFRGFEDSSFGKWWFQVTGADLVNFPSKVGTYPGEGTTDFPSGTYAAYTQTLKTLFKKNINPLQVAREAARAQGAEFHVMLRPAGWVGSMPYEETFNSKFFYQHPEWRCVDRDGTPTFYMSYAAPEVRRHLLDVWRETLVFQPDGVGLLFNRGMPLMLWEEPFNRRFRAKYGVDAKEVGDDDPKIWEMRAMIMTEFLTETRAMLDETARAQGRKVPYKISLGTFAKEADNQRWGLDLPRWIAQGLVDELAVTWFAYHTSFSQPDMAYYRRLTRGTKTQANYMAIAWKTGKPQDLCKQVAGHYAAGDTGIAVWDPQVEKGWTGNSLGNVMDVLKRIGEPETMALWARTGVPQPFTVPLTRLDENYFSRWFPNTGF